MVQVDQTTINFGSDHQGVSNPISELHFLFLAVVIPEALAPIIAHETEIRLKLATSILDLSASVRVHLVEDP